MKVFLIHLFYMKNYPELLDVSTKTVIDPASMTYVTTPTYTMKCIYMYIRKSWSWPQIKQWIKLPGYSPIYMSNAS